MEKPIFYYSVMSSNRGDAAIRKSITHAIRERLDTSFAFFNVRHDELTECRILNQLNTEASCLMIAGSGLYSRYPMSSGWYFPCDTRLFEKITVPIMLIGLGSNSNIQGDVCDHLSDDAKESIRTINSLAKISTVRDYHTFKLLSSLGTNHHLLHLCPANFLKTPVVQKEKRVAINVAQHSKALGRFDGGEAGKTQRRKNVECFKRIVKHLRSKDYSVVFIAHDALESSLIRELEVDSINTDNIDVMLAEYARCEFSIGMRMHSNILSCAAGTPFISVGYDRKHFEYLKMMGTPKEGCSAFEDYCGWLHEMVDHFILNWEQYLRGNEKVKLMGESRFANVIDKACNIIQTSQ